jgi:hypothetical protein
MYRMAEAAVDTKMVSESAVLDAMLLGDCDYFVGRCVTRAGDAALSHPALHLQLHQPLLSAGA